MEYIGDSHAIISGYFGGFLKMEDPQVTMGFNTKNPSMFNDLGYPHFCYDDHWDSLMIFPYTSDYDSGHMDYNGYVYTSITTTTIIPLLCGFFTMS